jgi:hypothetical protein
MDTELWFAADQERGQRMHAAHAAAVEVCTGCPVASDCLADALRFEACRSLAYRHGVWGGVRAAERAALADADADRARRLRNLAAIEADRGDRRHGTRGGYRYGCRCDPCRAAKAAANADYNQRRQRQETR